MKKYNEGYALPFVLVVMVIICLIGVSILSFSLSNLQSQKASIERMQDQYEAEGQIEKVMAILQQNPKITFEILKGACSTAGLSMQDGDIQFSSNVNDTVSAEDNDEISFTLRAQVGTIEVSSNIKIIGTIKKDILGDGAVAFDTSSAKYIYSSYEINTISEGGETDEG